MIDTHAGHVPMQLNQQRRGHHGRHLLHAIGVGVHHQPRLDVRRRVTDADAHHEAIELRLRQREGAGEVLRILRRQNDERIGQLETSAVQRHLTVVHRLQQCGLSARTSAVDLVGQKHVRKDRPAPNMELGSALVIHRHAQQVARQEVAGELHARHVRADRARQCPRQSRLANTGHVFNQYVTTRQQRDGSELDDGWLTFQRDLHLVS
jgi:hypothetical protein